MADTTKSKIAFSEFFVESTYLDSTGRTLPCYLISKMGCEMVANKLTGEKGVLFTAVYVKKFNEMETAERTELETFVSIPKPRLGEFNACARIIVHAMREMNASPEQIIGFLKSIYEPLGITVTTDENADTPRWYTAKQIAQTLGVNSLSGNPHYQAVACILNENIFIGENHKAVETEDYGSHVGITVRYDSHALEAVKEWFDEYGYPDEVYGFGRTYRVTYKD
jgi:hypothetical protein